MTNKKKSITDTMLENKQLNITTLLACIGIIVSSFSIYVDYKNNSANAEIKKEELIINTNIKKEEFVISENDKFYNQKMETLKNDKEKQEYFNNGYLDLKIIFKMIETRIEILDETEVNYIKNWWNTHGNNQNLRYFLDNKHFYKIHKVIGNNKEAQKYKKIIENKYYTFESKIEILNKLVLMANESIDDVAKEKYKKSAEELLKSTLYEEYLSSVKYIDRYCKYGEDCIMAVVGTRSESPELPDFDTIINYSENVKFIIKNNKDLEILIRKNIECCIED